MTDTSTAPKITCEACRELLSEYVDSEIDDGIRLTIERHLTECTRCVTESTRLQGLKKIVRHWDGVRTSGRFRASVMQQMIRESQQMQVPAGLAEANAARQAAPEEDATEPKRIPPVWILLAAGVLAVIVYFVVLKLRGM